MNNILVQGMPRWVDFAVKTFLVVFAIYLGISALLIPFYRIFDRLEHVMNLAAVEIKRLDLSSDDFDFSKGFLKLKIHGLISNPEVHYRLAEHYKELGQMDKALLSMSLAMGLTHPDVKKYEATYQEIQNALSNH